MTKAKITFAPGCFDGFEGTQDELDKIIADLSAMIDNDTLKDHAIPVDEEEEAEFIKQMQARLNRKVH